MINRAHGILVQVDFGKKTQLKREQVEYYELKARRDAMMLTGKFRGKGVFDNRSEFDAGRYEKLFPRNGVILGGINPVQLVLAVVNLPFQPLRNALEEIKWDERINWRNFHLYRALDNVHYLDQSQKDLSSGIDLNRYFDIVRILNKSWEDYTINSCLYSVLDDTTFPSENTVSDLLSHPDRYALVISEYELID